MLSASPPRADAANARWDRSFFGHPRGLSTLFFTEMWERFSYYGMRALLILFMTASVSNGGLGFPTSKAGSIYGLYTSAVFIASLPGGWIADKVMGQRRAVLYGGIIIALGHFSMAIPRLETFYLGLLVIVIGTGLLKPNISTIVGGLYGPDDKRRDAGFSVFYMGINLGAFIAPLVCGYLGENINWHYGFGAAGVGMTLGIIQYVLGAKYLGTSGLVCSGTEKDRRIVRNSVIATAVIALVGGIAVLKGWVSISAERFSNVFGVFLFCLVVAVFGGLFLSKGFSSNERRRIVAILVLFLAAALFWSRPSSRRVPPSTFFAERNTNLHKCVEDAPAPVGLFRASYFQALNSIFIIAFAPVFGLALDQDGKARTRPAPPSFPGDCCSSDSGFAILIPVANSTLVSPWWLTLTYLCSMHSAELCLSPVGLSAMTRLAPARAAGTMMGIWFLADGVGNFIGGRLASVYETFPLPLLFGLVAGFCFAVAVILIFLIGPMKRLSQGAK